MAHPVVGPIVQAAIAQMMGGMEGAASIMPEGVDMTKMMESFPIGRAGMFAAASGDRRRQPRDDRRPDRDGERPAVESPVALRGPSHARLSQIVDRTRGL